jgi:mono/diheme cytochrome c family protein
MTRYTFFALFVILSLLVVACNQQPTPTPTQAPPPEAPAEQGTPEATDEGGGETMGDTDLEAALVTFEAQCQSCHGENGMGGGVGPTLNPNEEVAAMSAEEIREIIVNGIEGSEMPAFGDQFSAQEIDHLIALLQTWQSSTE